MFDDPFILEKERTLTPYNPFADEICRAIGNTRYIVNVSCQGTEPMLGKIKRLLFDDPVSKEHFIHDKPA